MLLQMMFPSQDMAPYITFQNALTIVLLPPHIHACVQVCMHSTVRLVDLRKPPLWLGPNPNKAQFCCIGMRRPSQTY